MKGLAALGAAACIAGAVMLWFSTKPAVVTVQLKPLTPSDEIPTFKPVSDDHEFEPLPRTK